MSRPSRPGVPYVDPDVEFVGTARLKELSAPKKLGKLRKTCVIQENNAPVAVLMPFATFQTIQETIDELEDTVEEYRDDYAPLFDSDLGLEDFETDEFDEMDALMPPGPKVNADEEEDDETDGDRSA